MEGKKATHKALSFAVYITVVMTGIWFLTNGVPSTQRSYPMLSESLQDKLKKEIEHATKIRFLEQVSPTDFETTYESANRADLLSLSEALSLKSASRKGPCLCLGGPTLVLVDKAGTEKRFVLHHGSKLTTSQGWAELANSRQLDLWLLERGCPPSSEVLRQWYFAAPSCLQKMLLVSPLELDTQALDAVLTAEFPEEAQRAAELLRWYGRSFDWNDENPMQEVAFDLLSDISRESLAEVICEFGNDPYGDSSYYLLRGALRYLSDPSVDFGADLVRDLPPVASQALNTIATGETKYSGRSGTTPRVRCKKLFGSQWDSNDAQASELASQKRR